MKSEQSIYPGAGIRILYFATHQLWPANTGSRVRDYQLARHLAMRSRVTFVQMRQAEERRQDLPNDLAFGQIVTLDKSRTYTASKVLRGLVGPTPVTVLNCWSPKSASQLAHVLSCNHFDTIQIEGVHLIKYLPMLRAVPGSPAIIVDWHNVESEAMWRYANRTDNWAKKIVAKRTAKLIERAETWLLNNCATHTVPSERERQQLRARRPSANIAVIPNGVDCSLYPRVDGSRRNTPTQSRTILFVGSMDYHANVDAVTWFSRAAWPQIARNHPDMHFMIVGRDPPAAVRALASDRIHVTGTVDDVRPFYASALAVVAPIRSGSGTRVKILEAMAAGVPVVSTRLGAEGLVVEDGVHLLLADDGHEIALAVSRLASSVETRVQLSRAARALVCRTYDWMIIADQLYRIHADLVHSRAPSGNLRVSE